MIRQSQQPASSMTGREDHDGDVAAKPADAEVMQLHLELATQKDKYLRLAADFENFKRRTRMDAETLASAQKESFILELLPVIDNLERALISDSSGRSQKFHQGVEMTWKQLLVLLENQGIANDGVVGEPFDPHRHEALSQRSDPAHLDQSILEVLQRGYIRGSKVLRPAKVVINDLTQHDTANHAS